MRKWFLGDERAFAVGLDEMDAEESSDGDLSRRNSDIDLRPHEHEPHKANSYPLPSRDRPFPRPGYSVDDSMLYTKADKSGHSSLRSGTSSRSGNRPMGYQQRRMERMSARSSLSGHSPTPSIASPPAFSPVDPQRDLVSPTGSRYAGSSGATQTESLDSEMMRDLKDMFIAERDQQLR